MHASLKPLPVRRQARFAAGSLFLVVLLHIAGGLLVQAYRGQNRRWHGRDPLDLQVPDLEAPSPELELQTNTYLGRYSTLEFGTRNSRIVSAIKRDPPTEWVGELLQKKSFDGWTDLFLYVAIKGGKDDVIALAKNIAARTTDQGHLVLLGMASRCFLEPSVELAHNGSFRRALLLFDTYSMISMEIVRTGSWVSNEGVDLTDLAVMKEAFCAEVYRTPLSKCSLGLILAIDPSSTMGRSDFLLPKLEPRYAGLPRVLRNEELNRYLQGAALLTRGLPAETLSLLADHQPKGRDALASWLYLQARAEIALVRLNNKAGAPAENIAEAARQKLRTIVVEFPESPFAGPAARKLSGELNEDGR